MTSPKNARFKPVNEVNKQALNNFLETILEQQKLIEIVRIGLPTHLAGHVQHCVESGPSLIVYCDSAAWASQLRFCTKAILEQLRTAGRSRITKIQVRLVPQEIGSAASKRSPRLPSAAAIESICGNLADGSDSDELAAAMARLRVTLRRRTVGN